MEMVAELDEGVHRGSGKSLDLDGDPATDGSDLLIGQQDWRILQFSNLKLSNFEVERFASYGSPVGHGVGRSELCETGGADEVRAGTAIFDG